MTALLAKYLLGTTAVVLLALGWSYHQALVARAHKLQGERDDAYASLLAERAAHDKDRELVETLSRIADDANAQLTTAQDAAAGAYRAAERLRGEIARLTAAHAAVDTTTASQCAAESTAADLLANVLRESVDHNRALASVADESRVRGLACEASYGAVVAGDLR